MFSKSIFQSKTFYAFMTAVLGAWGAFFQGSMTEQDAITATIMAAIGIGMRLVSNGPVHVTTPISVAQAAPGAPVVKAQAGYSSLSFLLMLAVIAVPLTLLLPGCAANQSTSTTAANVAYTATQTATLALTTAHSLKVAGTITVQTEAKIVAAAQEVNAAAVAVDACVISTTASSTCTTTALDTALAALTALLPTVTTK